MTQFSVTILYHLFLTEGGSTYIKFGEEIAQSSTFQCRF